MSESDRRVLGIPHGGGPLPVMTETERTARLVSWAEAPGARWCHPREEHLLPLHVCYGAGGGGPARRVFDDLVLGKRASGYAW